MFALTGLLVGGWTCGEEANPVIRLLAWLDRPVLAWAPPSGAWSRSIVEAGGEAG